MQFLSSAFSHLLRLPLLILLVAGAGNGVLKASHNLAGEITHRFLGNNTVEITLTTYTDPSAALVDRCAVNLEIWNATGTIKIDEVMDIPRQNGPFNNDPIFQLNCPNAQMGEYIVGTIKRNVYTTTYQFGGPGHYVIRYSDLARLDNIINMANSGGQSFFVESSVLVAPIFGEQNSAQFLNHPIDFACTGKLWTHNPGAWDPDGDSLVFSLIECRQYDPPSIPSPIVCTAFQMPDLIGSNGPMTMDPTTGLITWNVPDAVGIYNIAYRVEEWRSGRLIDTVFRDMAIFVEPCNNNPPVIETILDTCVEAGELLEFDALFYDPDFFTSTNPPGDSIYVYLNNNGAGNNGPFAVSTSPATITFNPSPGPNIPDDLPVEWIDTVRAHFEWQTTCDHVRPAFYQVDFYAHDNRSYFGQPSTQMLSAHHVVKIFVKPPPLTGLTATAANREITLTWDPHSCDSIGGYEIYRKRGNAGWAQDSVCCESDPEQGGFQLIGTNLGRNNTTFVDDNNGSEFEYGQDYCYVVRAFTVRGVRTCTTEEVCLQIAKDFAILTKDSIDVTGTAGTIAVNWSQPSEIDTAFFNAPYTYTLLRADGISGAANFTTIASSIPFNDTTYYDVGMNTEVRGYRYRVDTYDTDGDLIAEGNSGSSVFLSISPGDQQLLLSWQEFVPWSNRKYFIYRADDAVSPLTLIDSVNGTGGTQHSYLDTELTNFEDYCYVIVSEGEYNTEDTPDSVRNASQRACGIPQDFEPPCIGTVVFDTTRDCETHQITFSWTNPDSACGADLDYWSIYRADNRDAPYELVAQIDSGVTVWNAPNIGTIADCYGITATDTNGNESDMRIYCFENCPQVEISNVFTPNGDGINDYFAPILNRNVRIALVQIYDRWGSTVYSSTTVDEPQQLWDGRNNNGQPVPDGVYYYLIKYEEDRLPGMIPKPPLVGNVTVLR